MIYDDRDDGMREQRMQEISDFNIVIDDENEEPNWASLMPSIGQQIEDWEFRNSCEESLQEEFDNICEKNGWKFE